MHFSVDISPASVVVRFSVALDRTFLTSLHHRSLGVSWKLNPPARLALPLHLHRSLILRWSLTHHSHTITLRCPLRCQLNSSQLYTLEHDNAGTWWRARSISRRTRTWRHAAWNANAFSRTRRLQQRTAVKRLAKRSAHLQHVWRLEHRTGSHQP